MDIQAAIIIDAKFGAQISFQYVYFVRANPLSDNFAGSNATTPCSSEPCQNGGFCVLLSNTTYNCLCSAGWQGKLNY